MATILQQMIYHLQDSIDTPGASVNPKITETLDGSLCSTLSRQDANRLMRLLAKLLSMEKPGLDLRPILELAQRISDRAAITYMDVLSIEPRIPLLDGLGMTIEASKGSTDFTLALNRLTLSLLQTAKTDAEIGIIAACPELVQGIIKLWLCNEDTGVGQKAWETLSHFLRLDFGGDPAVTNAYNLMWKRVLGDKDIYGSLFSWTSFKTLGGEGQLRRREKGIAQCRLMDLIKNFSHMSQLWQSQHTEIESRYVQQGEGLAQYVLLRMIDKNDVLEYMQLIDCCTSLLSVDIHISNKNLERLESSGIHSNLISQIDSSIGFFRQSIITYTKAYIANHPQHFLQYTTKPEERILSHIIEVLKNVRSNQWTQPTDPTEGVLELFVTIPRIAIISNQQLKSTFLSLPLDPPNIYILRCLAHLFCGLTVQKLSADDVTISTAAARVLFLFYLTQHPTFFSEIVAIASQLIVPEASIAAIDLLSSIAFARWATATDSPPSNFQPRYFLPSETELAASNTVYAQSSTDSLPESGLAALLMPPAVGHVLPFLLSGSNHLTGSEAYRIAEKKFDFIRGFYEKYKEMVVEDGTGQGVGLMMELEQRFKNGVFGAGVGAAHAEEEDVVYNVATLSQ